MYETFDHTADIGIRARSDTLNGLFEESAKGLFSVMVTNLDSIRCVKETAIELAGNRRDDLFFDWLAELLYAFDTRRTLFGRFEVHLSENGLSAVAWGEPLDVRRHEFDMEIKAVTYHGLKVEPEGEGWLAEVIVDL
jgi:SHS2 domain-containing protein